jgi:quercetin dioxygenase-like cupin family protein
MSAPYAPFDFSEAIINSIDVPKVAKELTGGDTFQKSGKVASTVARGANMTVVLTVLKEGAEIHEHGAPGPVTIVLLSGRVLLESDHPKQSAATLTGGSAAVFPKEVRHSLKGKEDSVFLVIIGGKRDT